MEYWSWKQERKKDTQPCDGEENIVYLQERVIEKQLSLGKLIKSTFN